MADETAGEAGGVEDTGKTGEVAAAAALPGPGGPAGTGLAGPVAGAVGIEMRDLRRSYGAVRALDGLSLTISPGELVALLGPSGCGKTTALRALAGFERPDSGEIVVGGTDVTGVPANKRGMGMVFQAYSLFPNLTALDNVAFGLRLRRMPARKRRARAGELLELVGLGAQAGQYQHQLSGGQQQRVALARALAIEPRVLLLDEPLSALDAQVRAQLRDEIRSLQTRLGITTLFVTHDQEEALSMADRVGVMRSGQLEQLAAPEIVYAWPETPFVAEFVGTVNRLPGTLTDGGTVEVTGQRLPVLEVGSQNLAGDVDVLVRPEAVVVTAVSDGAAGDGRGSLGRVVQRSFRGAITRVQVELPGVARAAVGGKGSAELADATADTAGLVVADVATIQVGDLAPGAEVRVTLAERPVLVTAPARA
ncbi:ABC transporter related protein [Pseudofrankia inefficax]|uniref:ABC-type quaternary amine transporter n=2 Tax=Pseudofrankia inefficax (strain DSM 45817 / CECT 9037 / DDB 130130 / EuI1c) TaxID=298654 RepID=E3IZL2_PSEI1|nr:ABC transporter related protein [Pseudofrankia inefficax]